MNQTRINHLAVRRLTELSGGQRQRAFLAMVLAQNTPVVLLDEPTTYLDINHQVDLMRLMGELRTQGKTVVAVLHDLNQASRYCDQLVVNGKRTCYGARHTRRGDDPRIAENSIQRGSGNTPRAGIWQADVPNEVDCTGRKNQTTTE
ncbi:iron-dicitrate transporter ATP-binding subunit [Escherichia coli]|nr:iron-dicitrate transporter ATP-binding subunit [Escherichia coli]